MSKRNYLSLLLAAFTGLFSLNSSAQTNENTLLWKITGKGLSKPSYLYGTMHVKDRRVFNLSDSVYYAMKNTTGFAMEIMPDSVMANLIVPEEKLRKVKDTTKVENLLSKEELEILDRKLIRHLGVGYKSVDLHRRAYLSRLMGYDEEHEDDMPTFLDAYLMGVSRRTGKHIYGLEQLSEYSNIDMERPLNRKDLLLLINTELQRKKGFGEYLTQLYAAEKLSEMCKMINTDSAFQKALLLDRNINMARRMDSLMQKESLFTAVGAAHLPEAGGVIDLLRKMGYTVQPVIATTKTPAANYPFALEEIKWHRYTSEVYNYELDLPGAPVKMNQTEASLSIYMDLGTGICYMIGEGTNYQGSAKDRLDAMIDRLQATTNFTISSKNRKEIMQEGFPGMEVVATRNKQDVMRMRLFVRENTVMFIMAFTEWKAKLFNPETDHVFSSLHFTELTPPTWLKMNFEKRGISISMPNKPAEQFKKGSVASGENFDAFAAAAPDNSTGIAYTVSQLTLKPGYIFDNDTILYSNYKNQMELADATIISESKDTINGLPANRLYVQMENGFFQAVLLKYTNHFMVLMASSGDSINNHPDVEAFFSSLEIKTGEQTTFQSREGVSGEFSTWAPRDFKYLTNRYELVPDLKTMKDLNEDELGDYEKEQKKYDASKKFTNEWSQISWDSLSGISYSITLTNAGKYYWAVSDSMLFRDMLTYYLKESDSIASFTLGKCGAYPSADVIIEKPFASGNQRIKLVHSGNQVYYLYAYRPQKDLMTSNADKFFTDFRVLKGETPSITHSKLDSLLVDLKSADTLTAKIAAASIEESGINANDLKALYHSILVKYPKVEEYYYTEDRLTDKFRELADSTIIPLLTEEYAKIPDSLRIRQLPILKALTKLKTKEAFELYGQLMNTTQYSDDFPYEMITDLTDTLELTRMLYPQLLNKLQDTVMALGVAKIAVALIDSNQMSLDVVKPYEAQLHTIMTSIKTPATTDYHDLVFEPSLISLLRFDDEENINLLKSLIDKKNQERSINAAVTLTRLHKNDNEIDAIILKAAEDPALRATVHNQMKDAGIPDKFPASYATPQSLAESELHTSLNYDDEYEKLKLTFLKEKDYVKNDTAYTCYLFLADFGKNKQLSVAGPYIKGTTDHPVDLNFNGSYYEPFNKKKIDEHFEEYIRQNVDGEGIEEITEVID